MTNKDIFNAHRAAPGSARIFSVSCRLQGAPLNGVADVHTSGNLGDCFRDWSVPSAELGTHFDDRLLGNINRFHQLSPNDLNGSLYRHRDSQAVRHLFRVAAGLANSKVNEKIDEELWLVSQWPAEKEPVAEKEKITQRRRER